VLQVPGLVLGPSLLQVQKDKGRERRAHQQDHRQVTYNNPDGTQILLRKEDRDEEFYVAPTRSGKKGKAKNKGKQHASLSPPGGHAKPANIGDNPETYRASPGGRFGTGPR